MVTSARLGNGRGAQSANRRTVALAVVLAVGLLTTGCAVFVVGAVAGVGAAGAAYVRGDLQARVTADPRAVEKAALKTFEALGISRIWSFSSAEEAEVVGRTADRTKISIKGKPAPAGECSISIRVGVFGDQYMSLKIYEEVKTHLPEASRALAEELKTTQP